VIQQEKRPSIRTGIHSRREDFNGKKTQESNPFLVLLKKEGRRRRLSSRQRIWILDQCQSCRALQWRKNSKKFEKKEKKESILLKSKILEGATGSDG